MLIELCMEFVFVLVTKIMYASFFNIFFYTQSGLIIYLFLIYCRNLSRFIVTPEILKSGSHMNPMTADMEGQTRSVMIFGLSLFSSKRLRVHNISPCLHKTQGYYCGFYLRRLLVSRFMQHLIGQTIRCIKMLHFYLLYVIALCSVQIVVEVWFLFMVRCHTVLIKSIRPNRRIKCLMILINTEKNVP